MHDLIHALPQGFPRSSRRAAGYRKPVSLLTEEHNRLVVMQDAQIPRYVKRHMTAFLGAQDRRRNRRHRARVIRIAQRIGI